MKTWLLFCIGTLLIGCSAPEVQRLTPEPLTVSCVIQRGTPSQEEEAAMKSLRNRIEKGPLYTVPAKVEGISACSIGYDSGVIALEYRFRSGGWLHVQHDARIEYTNQESDFELPPGENSKDILVRAERSTFGPNGCGIDWQNPETKKSDDHGVAETVFHGDVCNCQARIRRGAGGKTVGLMLRSTC